MSGEAEESGETQPPTSAPEIVQTPASATVPQPSQKAAHGYGHHSIEFRFLDELKRRNVGRIAILYLVVCWLILEPVHVIFHMLEVPVWANRLVIILMLLGFPAVTIFAWVYEITPEGLKPIAEIPHGQSFRRQTGRRIDRAIIVVLGLALTYFVVDKFWISKHAVSVEDKKALNAPAAALPAVISDKPIAVLPFADMSEKKDQEYFADGMAEEILDLLAKIPGLKVIGRTSSFQFKGRSDDLRAIGERLGASYVVEGSVRKAGARIRVTAQLIDSHSGIHLWSESYDRDYGDILVLQDDIATGIARALQLAVGADDLRPPRRLPSTEAYSLYLHARAALDRLDESMEVAQSELEQALVLDPSFVQAAEVLALMHAEQALNQWVSGPEGWRHAREAAETALRIDSNSARAHAVLGLVSAEQDYRWDEADAEIGKALRANPHDSFALDFAAHLAMHRGRYAEALRHIDTALSLDPLNPYAYDTKGTIQYLASDLHEAERSLRRVNELSPTFYGARLEIGWVLMARGELDAALKELLPEISKNAKDSGLAAAYHMMGRTAESNAALARLMHGYDDWPTGVALAHAARGERDQAMEWLEKAYVVRDPDLLLWGPGHPFFASLHDDPRYQALMLKLNLRNSNRP
jgi:TolB-like protein/Flp pilus assembly protein TadD